MISISKPIKQLIMMSVGFALSAAPAFAQETKEQSETPPWSMADDIWGADAMARSRDQLQASHGGQATYMLKADRFEFQGGGEDTLVWDLEGWYGGDINKFYIKTEGDYSFADDEFEEAEIQALWSRAVTSFWDVQAGIRYDLKPKGRTHAVLGLQGIAPYWFEIDAAAFFSTDGDLTARIEAEYEFLLTQKLILQPRVELEFSAQDISDLDIGAGLTSLDAGLRLRYEIKREFAPYVGVEWQRSLGETANLTRAAGNDADKIVFVLGFRAWF